MTEVVHIRVMRGGFPPMLVTGIFQNGELESWRSVEPETPDDEQAFPNGYIFTRAQDEVLHGLLRDKYNGR